MKNAFGKLVAIFVGTILFIPLFVFIGVPNFVFGYNNADYEDIIDFTDRAHYIDMAYRQVDGYAQECVDNIVNQTVAAYSESDVEFDEVSVNSDISNTDLYWLIAINSVAYKQDLYAMDETSIKEMLVKKMSWASEIVLSEESDGDVTATIRTLKVNVKDLNPEEVMDSLDFTDEERDWARLLHSTLESERPLNGAYNGGYTIPGEALSDERFAAMITEAEKYIGYPYVWGGSSPSTSFDCSGFVCWVINKSGVNSVGRTTAQGLFNLCTPVKIEDAKPGDLIFFHSTYKTTDTCTHVAIYVGDGMMIHAGNPIGYASFQTNYWQTHLYAFGRIGS